MPDYKMIGIVGGMGPYAGVDLAKKIFDETEAAVDQSHLPVALLSVPHTVVDRSRFLDGKTETNPADAIVELLAKLDSIGATVAGVPCNTAHAKPVFDRIEAEMQRRNLSIGLLHIARENARHIAEVYPGVSTIGIVATAATIRHRVYEEILESEGFRTVVPDADVQDRLVNPAIFDEHFGIKALTNPVSAQARDYVIRAIEHLADRGAELVILGCTELPLAVPEPFLGQTPLVDSTLVLARALIRETAPEKLKPARAPETA